MKSSNNISFRWYRSVCVGIRSLNLLSIILLTIVFAFYSYDARSMQEDEFAILGNSTDIPIVIKSENGIERTIYPGQAVRLPSVMGNQRIIIFMQEKNGDWTRHELWTGCIYSVVTDATNTRFEIIMEGRIKN